MPAAISLFVKHAPPVKKAASLIAEGDVEEEEEEEEDDDDDGPPPLTSDSEDDDDDDDSASSDDEVAPKKKKATKAEVSFAQRVRKVSFGEDVWRAGRDLEAVLDAPREMTTLVQTTSQASLSLTLPLARQIINKSGADTIAVPVWRKVTTPPLGSVEELAIDKYERYYKEIKVESMQQVAQDGLEILKDQFEERFFDDKRVLDRDLVALKLDPTINIKRVLVDKALIARAERVYNEMYWKTERELGKDKSPNKQKKKKSRRSSARPAGGSAGSAPSLLTQMQLPPDSSDGDSDDDNSDDDDDELGEIPKVRRGATRQGGDDPLCTPRLSFSRASHSCAPRPRALRARAPRSSPRLSRFFPVGPSAPRALVGSSSQFQEARSVLRRQRPLRRPRLLELATRHSACARFDGPTRFHRPAVGVDLGDRLQHPREFRVRPAPEHARQVHLGDGAVQPEPRVAV